MAFEQQLKTYLQARFTLIVVVTPEEERALEAIKSVCQQTQRDCLTWDVADGLQVVNGNKVAPMAGDPLTALEQVEKVEESSLFVLKDFQELWDDPRIRRKLRNVAQRLKYTTTSVIITATTAQVPASLSNDAVILELDPPDSDQMSQVLDQLTQAPGVKVNLTSLGREKLVQAALGLTAAQAQRVFAKAVVHDGVLDDRDIEVVTQEKKQIIRQSQALEFYAVTETPDDVGGLDVLKNWLQTRERAFTQEARAYGLPSPKGIALIGIPGTGKSLTAKMIGGLWRLPLLRLDVGALFGSLVGESEERTRRALRVAETVSPAVVWIDEMEKALAHGGLDSGTSTRVFATILTWMQEKTAPCFVVATANDIASLPPELLRKGRFDEIFFLDLPTMEERQAILTVHLRKRHRLPQDFEVDRLAAEAEGYTGAEIEQAVIDAMYAGFNRGEEFVSQDISLALRKQVPLSVSQHETIEGLRDWLRQGRAQSASFVEAHEAEQQFVPLQIGGA